MVITKNRNQIVRNDANTVVETGWKFLNFFIFTFERRSRKRYAVTIRVPLD